MNDGHKPPHRPPHQGIGQAVDDSQEVAAQLNRILAAASSTHRPAAEPPTTPAGRPKSLRKPPTETRPHGLAGRHVAPEAPFWHSDTIREPMRRIVHELQSQSEALNLCAVFGEDGTVVATTAESGTTLSAAITSALLAFRKSIKLVNLGELNEVIARTDGGLIVVRRATRGLCLLAVADADAPLGGVLYLFGDTLTQIEHVVD